MGRKVTDLMWSLNFEIGQNFKNRGHLYNKHTKFINRGHEIDIYPYNDPFCLINIENKQQYNKHLNSESIVPNIEEDVRLLKNCRFSSVSVVLCGKVQLHINIAYENLFYLLCDRLFSHAWSVVPLSPKDVPERRFCALIHKISASEAYPARLCLLPYKELCAIVFRSRSIINVVNDLDKCLVGFLEHTLRCKFEDESVHRGTCQMTKFLHKLLRYHLWLGLSVALNSRRSPSVSAFARGAVDEVREYSSFENFDYLPQCVLSLGNLVAKITFVFSAPLVFLDAQSFIGERNKSLVTFRNVKMVSFVVLCLGKQSTSLGVADIAYFHYLIGGRVEHLGIVIGHSDSSIKGIRFIITFGSPKVINQVLNNEVVCSFVDYHCLINNIPCKSLKSGGWLNAGYLSTLRKVFYRYPFNVPSLYSATKTIALQKYNEFPKHARSVKIVLTFNSLLNMTYCGNIAKIHKRLVYNYLCINFLHVLGCLFPVLKVMGLNPIGVTSGKLVDNQHFTTFLFFIIEYIPP